ncbi:MAG: molybdopterin-dependent oxidoreductase [Armatimonadetes bacterium]|nr:molybdopterin-dependent oxidoreductase [Armatimonadota bacterium]
MRENGSFHKAGWEEALDLIERRFKEIQVKCHKDATDVPGGVFLLG